MRISGLAGMVTVFVLSGAGIAAAQGNPEAEGRGPGVSFRNQRQQAFRKHYRTQHEENQSFRETLKDKTPAEVLSAVASHRRTQYGENKSFHADQYAELVAFIKERMAAREVPAEKQAEMLARLEACRDKVAGVIDEQHEKTMALIESLAARSDVTREEVRTALTRRLEEARSLLHGFRQEAPGSFLERLALRRQGRQNGSGEGHNRRGGNGEGRGQHQGRGRR